MTDNLEKPRGRKVKLENQYRYSQVDLDSPNPYKSRHTPGKAGRQRLYLNNKERYLTKVRQILAKFLEDDISMKAAISKVDDSLSTTEVICTIENQNMLGSLNDRIVKRILDTDNSYKMIDIASEIGVSLSKLKRIIESSEFQDAYNDFFFKTIADPRIKAIQDGLIDFAPDIWRVYRECLSPEAPYTVRSKMAMYLGEIIGVKKQDPKQSDSSEVAEFLAHKGIHADNIQIIQNQNVVQIPNDYKNAMVGIRAEVDPDDDYLDIPMMAATE